MTKFTSDSDKAMMYKEYTFTYIPVGYEINDYIHDDNWCYQEFLSTDGYIQIDQSKSSETSVQLDTENATYRIVRLKDIELHHVIKHNTHSVLWKIEGTTFYLTCKDNLEWEEIKKIILGAIPY